MNDEEKKRLRAEQLLAAVATAPQPNNNNTTAHNVNSDDDDDDDATIANRPPVAPPQRSTEEEQELLHIHTLDEEIEINNIRLFSFTEVDLNALVKCESLSMRKNLLHVLAPVFPAHLAGRLHTLDLFDNKIRKIAKPFFSGEEEEEDAVRRAQEEPPPQMSESSAVAEEGGIHNDSTQPNNNNNNNTTTILPTAEVALTTRGPSSSSSFFRCLKKLDLSYNQIRRIENLEPLADTLEELYLVENKIKIIENLSSLVHLKVLELGGNRIRSVGDGLRSLTSLEQLWLGKNKIDQLSGSPFGTLTKLWRLSLQANRLTAIDADAFPDSLGGCLKELYLSENGIPHIAHLQSLRALTLLDLSFNPITELPPSELNASRFPELEEFWLTDGQVSEWKHVDTLASFAATLRTVYLERNPIEADKRYRDKVFLALPFVTQIDSWPVVNRQNLEADRAIHRR